jgi:tripartite ATP-independent transporter DctP family solute receptor
MTKLTSHKLTRALLGLACCCAGLLVSLQVAAEEQRVLRAADTHPFGYPTVESVRYMADLLAKETDGRLVIKLYPGRQLGEGWDTLEQTLFGAVDLNRVSLAVLTNVIPETIIPTLPFLFRSQEHRDKVLQGAIGDEILAVFEEYGLVGLAFYESGSRSIYTSKGPVRHPDDLKGMRIRVPSSDVAVAMIEMLGGNATPMEFGQVYEAIRNGTVDGAENNWPSFTDTRHFEVADYYSLTEHTMMPEVLVMSKIRWDQLSSADQMNVRAAAKASVVRMKELWAARVEAAKAIVAQRGNKVLIEVDKAAFQKKLEPLYAQFASTPKLADLVRRIKELE